MWGSSEAGWVVGGLLVAVGRCLLNSCAQKRNKKLDILMVKIRLAPGNSACLISRMQSKENLPPILTPDFIQGTLSFPLYPFFLSYLVLGSKGRRKRVEKGWIHKVSRNGYIFLYGLDMPWICNPASIRITGMRHHDQLQISLYHIYSLLRFLVNLS